MKVRGLINRLKTCNQDKEILISSDEELNILFRDFEICELRGENKYCIFGLSGSEQ